MLRHISHHPKAEKARSFWAAALPLGASLVVPILAVTALELPAAAVGRIAAPVLGRLHVETIAYRPTIRVAEGVYEEPARSSSGPPASRAVATRARLSVRTSTSRPSRSADASTPRTTTAFVPDPFEDVAPDLPIDAPGGPTEDRRQDGGESLGEGDSADEGVNDEVGSRPESDGFEGPSPQDPEDDDGAAWSPEQADDGPDLVPDGETPSEAPEEGADEAGNGDGNAGNAPGHDPNGPGNSEDAPGHGGENGNGNANGSSENAPGHDPNGPGNSEDAPGHGGENGNGDGNGSSENAPGHDPNGPGNSENAPGHDPNGPGNSENAPGHTKRAA